MSDTSSRNLRTPEIPLSKFPNPRFFAYLCRIKIRHDMLLSNLTAISPVDGRYRKVTERLADYFSEYALIRYRVRVEVEYFIALCELPLPELKGIDTTAFERLRGLYRDFSTADAERVKEIERTTNHDVKAVEYLLKEKMDALGLGACKEFVHFGLTSQDINNTAIPLSIKEALAEVCYPALAELREKLAALAAGLALILALIAWFWTDHAKPDFIPCFWGSIGVIVASIIIRAFAEWILERPTRAERRAMRRAAAQETSGTSM